MRHLEAVHAGTAAWSGRSTYSARRRDDANEMVDEVLDRRCATDRRALHRVSATLLERTLLDRPYWSQPYWSQPYWRYAYGPKARGYYGTPYGPGPQFGSGGGDQYGYGPGYSYARQAPGR